MGWRFGFIFMYYFEFDCWQSIFIQMFWFFLAATNCFDLWETNQSVGLYSDSFSLSATHFSLTQWNCTASAGVAGRWSVLEPECKKDSCTRIHFPRFGKIYFPLMKQHVIWQIHCGKSLNVNTTWTQIFHLELVLSQWKQRSRLCAQILLMTFQNHYFNFTLIWFLCIFSLTLVPFIVK